MVYSLVKFAFRDSVGSFCNSLSIPPLVFEAWHKDLYNKMFISSCSLSPHVES